ncbi:PilT/PilU family type 4a pilus ATPase [Chryseoglobus sp. 28M-23]|uniref:type IV pilus twitching motility protein PilT n=1 Tax=Chryseoglobus sp. 28M-23 TaxID=2772253 RepID=UPI0024E0DD4E|nr:PilT/PilU family type 4a pilus ATPase [Chryseoglobus sp. 28M-23]
MTEANGFGGTGEGAAAPRRVWSVTDESAGPFADHTTAPSGAPVSGLSAPFAPPTAASVHAIPDVATGTPHLPPPPPVGQQPVAAPPPVGTPMAPSAAPPTTSAAAPPLRGPGIDAAPPAQPAYDAPPPVAGLGTAMPGIHPLLLHALDDLIARGGSDLHIAANARPMARIDGELTPVTGAEIWDKATVDAVLGSVMSDRQREAFDEQWELDFAISPRGEDRFRTNFYRERDSLAGAFRLIPTEIKSLKQLGVPSVVGRFATLPRGLVLVTGPTGSGKSTTLAALIDLVNKTRAEHIVTIEDPIEFVHANQRALVNQREVGADTHSFADALKRVLRQDPDVILIGELRDLETVSTALTAAETGHLVFATLHTQSAAQTIDRIIDVFPPHQQGQVRSQLALTLQGVVCQTLLPRATGKGRIIATEIMMTTGAIANLIREGKTYQITSALQAGREAGMHTMDQHLADLVNSHMVTHEAAHAKMQDPENFNRLVHRQATPMGGGGSNAMAASTPRSY